MALSDNARKALDVALGSKQVDGVGQEVADAIDSAANASEMVPAAAVEDLGATADLSAVAGTYADPAEPTGAEVDATVQASVSEIEARMDAIEAKIDELLAAKRAAGQLEE